MNATVVVGALIMVALFVLAGIRVNRTRGGAAKRRAVFSLALWAVVVVVGVTIWLIARTQTSK